MKSNAVLRFEWQESPGTAINGIVVNGFLSEIPEFVSRIELDTSIITLESASLVFQYTPSEQLAQGEYRTWCLVLEAYLITQKVVSIEVMINGISEYTGIPDYGTIGEDYVDHTLSIDVGSEAGALLDQEIEAGTEIWTYLTALTQNLTPLKGMFTHILNTYLPEYMIQFNLDESMVIYHPDQIEDSHAYRIWINSTTTVSSLLKQILYLTGCKLRFVRVGGMRQVMISNIMHGSENPVIDIQKAALPRKNSDYLAEFDDPGANVAVSLFYIALGGLPGESVFNVGLGFFASGWVQWYDNLKKMSHKERYLLEGAGQYAKAGEHVRVHGTTYYVLESVRKPKFSPGNQPLEMILLKGVWNA